MKKENPARGGKKAVPAGFDVLVPFTGFLRIHASGNGAVRVRLHPQEILPA